MGSKSTEALPKIDFSEAGLNPGSPGWTSVKSQVHEALLKHGCFEACYEKVDLELRKSTSEAVNELFDLPLETKLRYLTDDGPPGPFPKSSLYESLGTQDPSILQNAQAFTHLFWPEGNPTFCKTIQSFSEKMSEVAVIVRKMVLENLGVEKYMDEHLSSTEYFFRMIKYKAPETADAMYGLQPHTDKAMVTVSYQVKTNGLQVQTRDGDWIDVETSPASFVVTIGDSFKAWTNGRYHAPYHRVMMRGSDARYSLVLFTIPKSGYIIKAPEELVDEEHPLLFKPFDHAELLAFLLTEAGEKAECPLTAYCGVN